MRNATAGSNALGATFQSAKRAVDSIVKHHLSPLGIGEMAGFVAALALGWEEVASAILALHVVRIALMVVRDPAGHKAVRSGSRSTSLGQLLAYTGHGTRVLSHDLGHGWSHGLGHGWSHGLGHRPSSTLEHRE